MRSLALMLALCCLFSCKKDSEPQRCGGTGAGPVYLNSNYLFDIKFSSSYQMSSTTDHYDQIMSISTEGDTIFFLDWEVPIVRYEGIRQ